MKLTTSAAALSSRPANEKPKKPIKPRTAFAWMWSFVAHVLIAAPLLPWVRDFSIYAALAWALLISAHAFVVFRVNRRFTEQRFRELEAQSSEEP